MHKAKILIAEDDRNLGFLLRGLFEQQGYQALWFQDGQQALQGYQQERPDLLILDVMMPKKDGFSLAEQVRAQDAAVPILFLTARSMTEDVVRGFRLGGNDYVRKPFSMEELLVRVEALLKRQAPVPPPDPGHYTLGSLQFDYPHLRLLGPEGEQTLTPREGELLRMLCQQPGQVVSRKQILLQLWGDDSFFHGRSLDVFIAKLRQLLRQDPALALITHRGEGYRLVCPQVAEKA